MSDYWKYYHLSSDPFASDNGEILPFISDRWQQQLDLLLHLSETSHSVLVVVGVLGVGKTTMMKQFINHAKQDAGICEVKGDLSISAMVLLQILASHLGISTTDMVAEELKPAINQALEQLQQSNKRYLLVIDNAHKLPEDTLELILNFANESQDELSPLHIVLFGGPQLSATIANITAEQMGEALTHTERVEALTREETAKYIEHRLSEVGVQASQLLSEKDIDEIFRHSSGVPIKTNFFAKNTLIRYLPPSETRLPRKGSFLRRHWAMAAGVAVLAILVGALVLTPHTDQSIIDGAQKQVSMQLPSAKMASLSTEKTISVHKVISPRTEGTTSARQGMSPPNQAAELQARLQLAAAAQLAAAKKIKAQLATIEQAKAHSVADTRVQLAVARNKAQLAAREQAKVQQAANTQAQLAAAKNKTQHAAREQVRAKPVTTTAQASSATMQQLARATSTNSNVIPAEPAALSAHKATINLTKEAVTRKATMPNYGFTLQFFAAVNLKQAKSFIVHYKMEQQAKIVHIKSRGKDWYVVVYGDYKDTGQARLAAYHLPKQLKRQKPWIRSFASLNKRKVA